MHLISRACLATALLVMEAAVGQSYAADRGQTKFQRISTQYIAALGAPGATSGSAGVGSLASGSRPWGSEVEQL